MIINPLVPDAQNIASVDIEWFILIFIVKSLNSKLTH